MRRLQRHASNGCLPVQHCWYLQTKRVKPSIKALRLTSANWAFHSLALTCYRSLADHMLAVCVGRRD